MAEPDFVPMALKLDEAEAAFQACRVAFGQLTSAQSLGDSLAAQAKEVQGSYARAMYQIGKAIDKARGEEDPE